jgi:hypothetical protein
VVFILPGPCANNYLKYSDPYLVRMKNSLMKRRTLNYDREKPRSSEK